MERDTKTFVDSVHFLRITGGGAQNFAPCMEEALYMALEEATGLDIIS